VETEHAGAQKLPACIGFAQGSAPRLLKASESKACVEFLRCHLDQNPEPFEISGRTGSEKPQWGTKRPNSFNVSLVEEIRDILHQEHGHRVRAQMVNGIACSLAAASRGHLYHGLLHRRVGVRLAEVLAAKTGGEQDRARRRINNWASPLVPNTRSIKPSCIRCIVEDATSTCEGELVDDIHQELLLGRLNLARVHATQALALVELLDDGIASAPTKNRSTDRWIDI